ncbi:hypothetical protein CPB84DRAFT_1791091 [Gymnopilus junonius]|uniref:Uncharacterized protein n=1 Tax=Gymnopilus junonius TaxID=109634 RepID=A0A9P5NEX7_GYMJU|nr:hypothetical protein CPB84DRAFT_1791091 [Gymnopilus junonius]
MQANLYENCISKRSNDHIGNWAHPIISEKQKRFDLHRSSYSCHSPLPSDVCGLVAEARKKRHLGLQFGRLTVAAITPWTARSRKRIHGKNSGDESPHYTSQILLSAETHMTLRGFCKVLRRLTGERQITLVPAALSVSYEDMTILPVIDCKANQNELSMTGISRNNKFQKGMQ